MPNQNLPLPPLEDIAPHILKYWKMKKTDLEIIDALRTKHIDTSLYGISRTSFRKIRKSMGLERARQQAHTIESIRDTMVELRERFPKAGAREMVSILFHERKMQVPRSTVSTYFKVYEPELIRERKLGRLKRRHFWSAGVNDLWAVDQHDKWKKYGLALHTGVDPFTGVIKWQKIWWTNSNPKLILSYYLDVVEETGYMPLVTQSDPGSENYGIANGHTTLRHLHDPNLVGTIQHRWMRHKKNVMPEIAWSQLRGRFTPGFEDILQKGVDEGWFDVSNALDVLVFRWIFMPWLQAELDQWVDRVNNTRKRANRNKVTPQGVPNDIASSPERYGCLDFKIKVDPALIQEYAGTLYESMGSPPINWKSVWDVYNELLHRFQNLEEANNFIDGWSTHVNLMDIQPEHFEGVEQGVNAAPYELLQGKDLGGGAHVVDEDGNYYMGGVNNGHGLDTDRYTQEIDDDEILEATFSTDEEEGAGNAEQDQW